MRDRLVLPLLAASVAVALADTPPGEQGAIPVEDGDVVALAGGTTIVKQLESGYLEILLGLAADAERVRFRDVGWQSDTVFRQQRPMNFGNEAEKLPGGRADVLVVSFGQLECLEGATHLGPFIESYERFLNRWKEHAGQIVLIGPHPFGRVAGRPHLPDLRKRNGDAMAYSGAIAGLAKRRGVPFIDLSGLNTDGLTTDGIHLTEEGRARWAEVVAAQWTGRKAVLEVGPNGSLRDPRFESLRQEIAEKNLLWRQFRRPTNWAFLYGDRQHVPSSKDHRPGKPRWFPKEIEAIPPLIEAAEARIDNLFREARR